LEAPVGRKEEFWGHLTADRFYRPLDLASLFRSGIDT